LTRFEQKLKSLIGIGSATEAGVLAHRPQAVAVHRWVDASGVRRLTRFPDLGGRVSNRFGRIQRLNNNS
jgi:hypothetical protein